MDDSGWSIYGAERSQPVATGGNWEGLRSGSNKPKPLPPVATSCRSGRMIRRGSPVRVRKRALEKPRKSRFFRVEGCRNSGLRCVWSPRSSCATLLSCIDEERRRTVLLAGEGPEGFADLRFRPPSHRRARRHLDEPRTGAPRSGAGASPARGRHGPRATARRRPHRPQHKRGRRRRPGALRERRIHQSRGRPEGPQML